jgi:hypothetical protein
MNSLRRPNLPEGGFSRPTGRNTGPGEKTRRRNAEGDGEIKEYTLEQIKVLAEDHITMVKTSRFRNKNEYWLLVSVCLLIQLLIEEGVKAKLITLNQVVPLPRQPMGIDYTPFRNPVEGLIMIIRILIKLLVEEANKQKIPSIISSPVFENSFSTSVKCVKLERCLAFIGQNQRLWNITFDADEFNNRVHAFFDN